MPAEAVPAVPTNPAIDAAKVAQSPPKEATADTATVRVRAHERAAKVKAKLEDIETKEPSEEPVEKPAAKAKPKVAAKAPPAHADDDSYVEPPAKSIEKSDEADNAAKEAEKRRAERLERLAKARDRERRDDEERLAKNQGKQLHGEIERLRKRIAELEPHEGVFKDEDTLLAAAEARGLSAEKLVTWMRTRLSDPNAVAQRQAQSIEEKLRAEMRAMQERLDRAEQDRQRERAELQSQHEAVARAQHFVAKASEATDSHPLTAGLLSKHGERGLIAFANQFVAPLLPEGYALEELHDHIEQLLDEIQVASGGQSTKPPGTPANGTSHSTPKNGAAKPPTTTLSNRLSSERVSVAEEIPFARLPRQERVRLIKEKLDGE